MRCSDRVFTWSNGAGVWTSLRHVGRIKASRFESDHATLPWLLIKDRDTEPASQPARQMDGQTQRESQRQDRETGELLSHEDCILSNCQREKGIVKKELSKPYFSFFLFFFVRYSHFKSDGLWMGVMNPMTDLSEISRPHRKVRTTSSFAVQKNIDSCLDLGRKGW